MLTNPGKLSLAKGIAIFVSAFFPKLLDQEPKYPLDWIVSDIWVLLSFIYVAILLAKGFLVLVVCFVVKNYSCGNSSSLKLFLVDLNVVSVLFFATDFNLFNCVFC